MERVRNSVTPKAEIACTCVSLPISRCTSLDDAMDIAEIVNGYRR